MYARQIPQDRGVAIEARLGDLDLKNPDELKANYWRDVEQQLIDGGWYMGTEVIGARQREKSCQLMQQ